MKCEILKNFPFAKDGINIKNAEAGETVTIPERLVKGLIEGGFISPAGGAKAVQVPENKAVIPTMPAAPVVDDELKEARDMYQEKMGKRPFHGWDVEEILERMDK